MKTEEIRNLSESEREVKLRDIAEEYFNLKFQLATGKIENPGRMRLMRRDIAKIKTVQAEAAGKAKKV
jgi:large subunit ribosomal protein L29